MYSLPSKATVYFGISPVPRFAGSIHSKRAQVDAIVVALTSWGAVGGSVIKHSSDIIRIRCKLCFLFELIYENLA